MAKITIDPTDIFAQTDSPAYHIAEYGATNLIRVPYADSKFTSRLKSASSFSLIDTIKLSSQQAFSSIISINRGTKTNIYSIIVFYAKDIEKDFHLKRDYPKVDKMLNDKDNGGEYETIPKSIAIELAGLLNYLCHDHDNDTGWIREIV